jgi:hypothetical protein
MFAWVEYHLTTPHSNGSDINYGLIWIGDHLRLAATRHNHIYIILLTHNLWQVFYIPEHMQRTVSRHSNSNRGRGKFRQNTGNFIIYDTVKWPQNSTVNECEGFWKPWLLFSFSFPTLSKSNTVLNIWLYLVSWSSSARQFHDKYDKEKAETQRSEQLIKLKTKWVAEWRL